MRKVINLETGEILELEDAPIVERPIEEIEAINKTKEDEYKNSVEFKINEAKQFLNKSDKKVLPDYEFKEGDNSLEWYIEERSKARAFIRANEVI